MNPTGANDDKTHKKRKKILIAVALVIIAIPLFGYLLLLISFSGGVDGVISGMKSAPDPYSSKVSAKRAATKNNIEAAFSQIEQSSSLSQHASSSYDHCYKGQNNWKVKEGYAYRCDYRVTRYYGFNGDFRGKMLDLEQQLYKQEWQASNGDKNQLSYFINDPQVNADLGGTRLVTSMPTVINGYSRGGMVMDIAYGEKGSKDTYWLESTQDGIGRGLPIYADKKFIDVKSVFAEIAKNNTYVLAISLEKSYFEN